LGKTISLVSCKTAANGRKAGLLVVLRPVHRLIVHTAALVFLGLALRLAVAER